MLINSLIEEKGFIGEMECSAVFDRSYRYRYRLTRVWDDKLPSALFIMLNPSQATATRNDPTVSRCIALSARLGFGSISVVNLFALRSPYPARLLSSRRPVGAMNDRFIRESAMIADKIIIAWGNWGGADGRGEEVLSLLSGRELYCFGKTKKNQPLHPLYISRETPIKKFL